MKKEKELSSKSGGFFGEEVVVANIGIKPFFEDLKKQNVKVAHVDWSPPAGGDDEVVSLLDKLLGGR